MPRQFQANQERMLKIRTQEDEPGYLCKIKNQRQIIKVYVWTLTVKKLQERPRRNGMFTPTWENVNRFMWRRQKNGRFTE